MEHAEGSRLAKVSSFHDDLESATKLFIRLNSYRKLNGCKQLDWDQVLCELAVSRSHEMVRDRAVIMQIMEVGGAKFNLGVSYVDITSYIPIEEKDGKRVPVYRTMESVWNSFPRLSDAVLDPLARFAAVSVYTSGKMVCVTIFVSILPSTLFSPRRLKNEERRRKHKKRTVSKRRRAQQTSDIDVSTDKDSNSLDVGELTPASSRDAGSPVTCAECSSLEANVGPDIVVTTCPDIRCLEDSEFTPSEQI